MLNYSNGMEETMKSSVFKERRKNLADLILNNELYVPMKTKEIAILLGIPKELRHELQEVLDSLVADGTIGVSKKGKYMKPDNVAQSLRALAIGAKQLVVQEAAEII